MSDTAITVDELTRSMVALILPLMSAGGLTGAVFDSVVTGTRPARYAVLNLSRGIGSGRLTGEDTEADWLLAVQSIGTTPDQARWVQSAAIRSLLDVRINPAGWRSTPIRHSDSQPVDWDDSGTPALAYAVDSFRWRSNKQ